MNLWKIFRPTKGISRVRMESNRLLRLWGMDVWGYVLSIGSADDQDGEGHRYCEYFPRASLYLTSEPQLNPLCDLVIDVRDMRCLANESLDCVFCSGVLEHVDHVFKAVLEIHRVLKPGGVLLLGLPFRQPIHLAPHDFWRFTEYGVRTLLKDGFSIEKLEAVDENEPGFPAAYWCLARRL